MKSWLDDEFDVPEGWGAPGLIVVTTLVSYAIVSMINMILCWDGCKVWL